MFQIRVPIFLKTLFYITILLHFIFPSYQENVHGILLSIARPQKIKQRYCSEHMQTATIFFNQFTINKDIFNEKNLFIARNLTKKDENYRYAETRLQTKYINFTFYLQLPRRLDITFLVFVSRNELHFRVFETLEQERSSTASRKTKSVPKRVNE